MLALLQPLGAMTGLLAIWLVLCGVRNGFLFVLFVAASNDSNVFAYG